VPSLLRLLEALVLHRVLLLSLLLTTACAVEMPPEPNGFEVAEGALSAAQPLAYGQTLQAKAGKTGAVWTVAASGGGTFRLVTKAPQPFTVAVTRQFGKAWKSVAKQLVNGGVTLDMAALGPHYRVTVTSATLQNVQITLTCVKGKCKPPVAPPAADCLAPLQQSLAPTLQGLLYLSESDYPFDVVSFPSTTTGMPMPVELLANLKLPADTYVEVRQFGDWFAPLLVQDDPPNAAQYLALKAKLAGQLTNLTVIRVGKIQIGVYVIGRTTCGTLAGIKTVAIET
jgi:hypothetical protein